MYINITGSPNNKDVYIYPRLFTAIPCEVAEIHVITVF